jgi:sugar lactone lactonase YvrE
MDTLFFLDQQRGAILACQPDGTGIRTVVADCPEHPDGIAIDAAGGYIYWTNMGRDFKQADGSIERCKLDGSERRTIVPRGLTFTPKQIVIHQGYLYWCDREGMRILRCTLDGGDIEVLLRTGDGEQDRADARNWCVGIALREDTLYWTQKGAPSAGQGRILRAPLAQPAHSTVLYDGLPEPVDLEFGPDGALYWTDRARTPHGGSVQRTTARTMGHATGAAPARALPPPPLAADLGEAIGIAIDARTGRMYISTLQGDVVAMRLDGGERRTIVRGVGRLTGICYHHGHD